MNATLLKLFGRLNAFPGRRHLDQHAVTMNTLSLIKRNDALATRDGRISIKTQAGVVC